MWHMQALRYKMGSGRFDLNSSNGMALGLWAVGLFSLLGEGPFVCIYEVQREGDRTRGRWMGKGSMSEHCWLTEILGKIQICKLREGIWLRLRAYIVYALWTGTL